MDTLHEGVAVAYGSLSAAKSGTVDNYILAERIVVADNQRRRVAAIVEVLRHGTKHCVLVNRVATSETRSVHYADVRIDNAVVADDNIALNICERINRNIFSYFRLWVYFCFWTYHNFNSFYALHLIPSSAECIIQIDDSLHLIEVVLHL